jgi:hypothetical protein
MMTVTQSEVTNSGGGSHVTSGTIFLGGGGGISTDAEETA